VDSYENRAAGDASIQVYLQRQLLLCFSIIKTILVQYRSKGNSISRLVSSIQTGKQ